MAHILSPLTRGFWYGRPLKLGSERLIWISRASGLQILDSICPKK